MAMLTKRKIARVVPLAVILPLCSSFLLGNDIVGVLYGDRSGPSSSGTGEIRIAAAGRVMLLRYQKPYPKVFTDKQCEEPGAIWRAATALVAEDGLELVRAECTGKLDPKVHNAWLLAREYLDLLSNRDYRDAYRLFALGWQAKHSLEHFEEQMESMYLQAYRKYGRRGRCIQVLSTDPDGVRVRAGIDCQLEKAGQPIDGLDFKLTYTPAKARWEIVNVTLAPFNADPN